MKILAYARDWHAAGIIPTKERNPETGRMRWPKRFLFKPVNEVDPGKIPRPLFRDDVPLVALTDDLLHVVKLVASLPLIGDGIDRAPDDRPIYQRDGWTITVGDVRRAQAVLAEGGAQ